MMHAEAVQTSAEECASSCQSKDSEGSHCLTCALLVIVTRMKTTSGGSHQGTATSTSQQKKQCNWWCSACGREYDWRNPDRILVIQDTTDRREAKVFRAHAPPTGVCENLWGSLKPNMYCGLPEAVVREGAEELTLRRQEEGMLRTIIDDTNVGDSRCRAFARGSELARNLLSHLQRCRRTGVEEVVPQVCRTLQCGQP